MERSAHWTLATLFLVVLAVPPVAAVVAPETSVIPDENRSRAALPDVAAGPVELFRGFEAFFDDHLGLRYPLVKTHHFLKFHALRQAPTDHLLVGRDGWLFLARDFGLASYRAETPFTPDELEAWAALLADAERVISAGGARLLVVIAPNKSTIYEDKMPPGVTRASARTRTDQLVERLRGTEVEYLDLRGPLLEARRRGPVYARRDSHWNGNGAYVAYRAILERLGGPKARLAPGAVKERREVRAGDLAKMVPLGRMLREEYRHVEPVALRARRLEPDPAIEAPSLAERQRMVFEVADARLPSAAVYRDSFGSALIPLLSEHFRRSVWRWERSIEPGLIEAERPDVVIFQLVERLLMDAVPENRFRSPAAAAALSRGAPRRMR